MFKLLSRYGGNPKIKKGDGEYLTASLSLAPSRTAGRSDVCQWASPACRRECLNICGRGQMNSTQAARIRRTQYFFDNMSAFYTDLMNDLEKHLTYCSKRGIIAVVRLNTFSDLQWEILFPNIFKVYSQIQFYDYTKCPHRCMKSYKTVPRLGFGMPENYHLTFSRSETNHADVRRVLRSGKCNVAVVFRDENLPETYLGRPVINGDETDLRFLDPQGVIVGLKAKGKRAKADTTGFVV